MSGTDAPLHEGAAGLGDPVVASPETDDQEIDVIEGGEINHSAQDTSWKDNHESETAKTQTYAFVAILAGSFAVHYIAVTVLILCNEMEAVSTLTALFDKWLPVISSFVASATTYYLSHRKN